MNRSVRIAGVASVVVALVATVNVPGAWSAPTSNGTNASTAAAGQPYAPNWFPNELLAWDPATDPDAPFNRSTTPLASTVSDELTTANPDAKTRRVMALSVFGNTDGNPSQGAAEFDYYTSEFWPYLDTMVFWGGSSGEGLVLAPNPTVTDAAHRNGVPVLGTVFFPPEVYGGKLQWVREFLSRDADGHFPAARQLARVAEYYGFEGWFINQETEGGDRELATDMRDFLDELRAEGQQVLWYDSMVESGKISWQDELNQSNDDFFASSDLMFLNYNWDANALASSAEHARSMGRNPDELHAGVDVGWRQYNVQSRFDTLFPNTGESGLSVALYRPDFTLTGTDDPSQYEQRESRFWVGADADPSESTADSVGWKGMSSKIAERTPVTRMPFVTTFDTGHGTRWAHNGTVWNAGEWNNLTAQDVLPTWRWLVHGSPLELGYDYDRPYRGGSSIAIRGDLAEPTRMPLYATRLAVNGNTRLELTVRGQVRYDAVLRFADAPDQDVVLPLGDGSDGWTTKTASLADYKGRTLTSVGVRLSEPRSSTIDVRVGRLALLDSDLTRPESPSQVAVSPSGEGARVTWKASPSKVVRYDVEAVAADGTRSWLGTTTGTAYWVDTLPAGTTSVEVRGIGTAYERGKPGVVSIG